MRESGLSVTELAAVTGLSKPTISSTLSGRRRSRATRMQIYLTLRPYLIRKGKDVSYDDMWSCVEDAA
ncbi:MAG: hypothetical protein JW849_10495 [Phycisphaerae bacterium]|nr:hypothetical protein [Phycisphaerae bacterium]